MHGRHHGLAAVARESSSWHPPDGRMRSGGSPYRLSKRHIPMHVENQALHQTAVTKFGVTVMFAADHETDMTNLENTVINDWLQ
jgi:hypothetical protein